jgi:hypothetical protein
MALYFNNSGVNGDDGYLLNTTFVPSIPFSLAYWVKLDSIGPVSYTTSLSSSTLANHHQYTYQRGAGDHYGVYNRGTGAVPSEQDTDVLTANQWYHIIFTVQGVNLAINTNMYLDGTDITVGGNVTASDWVSGVTHWAVGRLFRSVDMPNGATASGKFTIKEMGWWDKTLSAGEATTLATEGNTPADVSTSLVHHWPLLSDYDDAVGTEHFTAFNTNSLSLFDDRGLTTNRILGQNIDDDNFRFSKFTLL